VGQAIGSKVVDSGDSAMNARVECDIIGFGHNQESAANKQPVPERPCNQSRGMH
jgi:hypothetical protein